MGYRANTPGQEIGVGLVNAATRAALTGATVTAYRSVDGGAQTPVTGAVTEMGNGQYVLSLSAADLDGASVSLYFTAPGAMPDEKTIITGRGVLVRGTAGQHIGFGLVNAATNAGLAGATVTTYRSIDGSAQVAATGTVTNLGLGQYDFSPSAADLQGTEISFIFTATNAVLVERTVQTVPSAASGTSIGQLIESALLVLLQAVPFDGIDPIDIVGRKLPHVGEALDVAPPCCLLAAGVQGEEWEPETTEDQCEYGYFYEVAFIKAGKRDMSADPQVRLWVQQARRALGGGDALGAVRLTAPTVWTLEIRPDPLYDRGQLNANYSYSGFTVVARSAEQQ